MVAHACTPSQAKAKELLREEASLSYIVGDPGLPELHCEIPPFSPSTTTPYKNQKVKDSPEVSGLLFTVLFSFSPL